MFAEIWSLNFIYGMRSGFQYKPSARYANNKNIWWYKFLFHWNFIHFLHTTKYDIYIVILMVEYWSTNECIYTKRYIDKSISIIVIKIFGMLWKRNNTHGELTGELNTKYIYTCLIIILIKWAPIYWIKPQSLGRNGVSFDCASSSLIFTINKLYGYLDMKRTHSMKFELNTNWYITIVEW